MVCNGEEVLQAAKGFRREMEIKEGRAENAKVKARPKSARRKKVVVNTAAMVTSPTSR